MGSKADSEGAAPTVEAASLSRREAARPRKRHPAAPPAKAEEPAPDQPEGTEVMSSEGLPHVHAPHGGVHTWRDFFVHVAIIALGLLLALGLQQIVEAVHHANQRAELEEQMRETFEANARIDRQNLQVLGNMREYFVGLHNAVAARQKGETAQMPVRHATTTPRLVRLAPSWRRRRMERLR